jgi:hypothetical protein
MRDDERAMFEHQIRQDEEIEKLSELKAAYELAAKSVGCGDNSCMFVKHTGMGTNGGCRCMGRSGGHMPGAPMAMAKLFKAVKEFIEENS